MYIRMVGPYVTVKLNDKPVVNNVVMENYYDRTIPVFQRGPIYLQTHGAETRFRNVFVREIPTEEANRVLAEIGGGDARISAGVQRQRSHRLDRRRRQLRRGRRGDPVQDRATAAIC